MSEIDDYKPYSLTAEYLENTAPSQLTAPFNLTATYDENLFANYLLSTISCSFIAEINGVNLPPVDNTGYLEAFINCSFSSTLSGTQDMNNLIGVFGRLSSRFENAFASAVQIRAPFAKPILKTLNNVFYSEMTLTIEWASDIYFQKCKTLHEAVKNRFEKGTGLTSSFELIWQEDERLFITRNLVFETGNKIRIDLSGQWEEMIRKRKIITYSHEAARVIEKHFEYDFDKSLELFTTHHFDWDIGKAIYYKKHPVNPWVNPDRPEYKGQTDLNFLCQCLDVDSHNLILNFGADNCLPKIENTNWWHILNILKVTRLDTEEEIIAYDGSYVSSRSDWCWSYSLNVPPTELIKLTQINDEIVILKIEVNGEQHLMLYEGEPTTSRQFGKTVCTLNGRSITALLSHPYSPLRSYLQENERTSVELVQAEIDRVNLNTILNWDLYDYRGWIVESESLTYANLSPIDAIKRIAEAGGGFVYSEKGSNTLSIKPLYKKAYWESLTIDDYDRLIPESIVTNHKKTVSHEPDYNIITLTNPNNGKTGRVKKSGTAEDISHSETSNPLFNEISFGWFGKSKLARAGEIEDHEFTLPIDSVVGECVPGELVAFNGEWWGVVDSVRVSFSHKYTVQTVQVERVMNEQSI